MTKLYHNYYLGPIVFKKNENFIYKQSPEFINKTCPQPIQIDKCPLCNSTQHIMIGKFLIDELIDTWVKRIDFNPIADAYRHLTLKKNRCTHCGLTYYNYQLPDCTQLYEELADKIDYYPNYRPEYGLASKIIEELHPKTLLEVGCGNGSFLERIQGLIPNAQGNEYNVKAAKIAKEKGLNISTNDITSFTEKFDIVCCFEVLEHITNTHKFIQNCIQLLNPKGKLIFGTPNPDSMLAITGSGWLNIPPHHQYDFSYQTFEFLAQQYNLKIYTYQKAELEYRNYEKYIKTITGKDLETPDISGYYAAQQKFTGHSHLIVFEKQ